MNQAASTHTDDRRPRVGTLLFGGSFNPIHNGHLIIARAVAEQLHVPRVILIPSRHPPHKQTAGLAPAEDRLAMCRLAVDDEPRFEVSDWELRQSGKNYTLLTVRHFREALGDHDLAWLIGMDSLTDLPNWYEAGQLAAACTLVTAARPGFPRPDLSALADQVAAPDLARIEAHILETPRIDISASAIRARLRAGRSVRYLVPDAVRAYLEDTLVPRGFCQG